MTLNPPNLPLVSIVLATYNGEKYLKQQLDSILQQDYPNIELVITDDCSSDRTLSILKEYASHHSHIHIYTNDSTLGLNKNFEKGMLLAQGEYIAISDQDDIWKSEKISVLMSELEHHMIVYHDSELIDATGSPLNRKLSEINRLSNFTSCLNYAIATRVPGHTMLFRRELIAQCVPFPQHTLYDHWLAFVATFNSDIKFIPETLVSYRQHENNTFGADFTKRTKKIKKKKHSSNKHQLTRERIQLFYDKCPPTLSEQKKVLHDLLMSYEDFSLKNNFRRMILFFKYHPIFLAHKKYGPIRKWLYCLKTFVKIP